jgi:vitamin B12 transporter
MNPKITNLLFVLLLSTPAFAEQTEVVLPEVVVTASRLEEPLDQTPQDAAVITRADIEKKGVPFVIDLLRSQPDLQIVQNGGPGTQATLLMRGSGSNQLLLLVDGINFNSPSVGSTDLSSLLTSDIERIEIIKGPLSTLYGSNAMAGVINIITKKGTGKPKADVNLEGGSFSTYKTTGSVSGGTEKINYRMTASYFQTDGIPIAKNGVVSNGDKNTAVSSRLGINPTENSSVDLNLRYGKDKTNIDNDFGSGPVDTLDWVQNHETWLTAITGKVSPWEKYEQSLTLSTLWDDLNYTDPDPAFSFNNFRIKSKTETLDWQHTLLFDPFTITGGFVYRSEEAVNDGSFDQSIYNKAWYLNATLGLIDNALILNIGGRNDDHSVFGDAFTYRGGVLLEFKKLALKFKANYGTGFRAPALNELYFPFYGNTSLIPERSTGYDIGVEKTLSDRKFLMGASFFRQDYVDLIQTNFTTFTADNIGHAQTEGVEINVASQIINNLKLTAAYTYLEALNRDNDTFLNLRPRNKVTSSIEWIVAKLTVMGEYQYVSNKYDSYLKRDISPYSLVNMKGSYLLEQNLSLFARIENLFNADYEEIAGYGTPGLSAYGGVKVSF